MIQLSHLTFSLLNPLNFHILFSFHRGSGWNDKRFQLLVYFRVNTYLYRVRIPIIFENAFFPTSLKSG